MRTLIWVFLASFITCLALIPLFRVLALRIGLVDHPDGHRKTHRGPVPVVGGIAILVTCFLVLSVLAFFPDTLPSEISLRSPMVLGLLPASLIIVATGVVDDVYRVRGRYKLLGQLLAIACLIASGLTVNSIQLFDRKLDLGPLSIPFTVFWLLGAINSLNLIDGLDGMLGCVGAIICLAMAAMAVLAGQWVAACLAFLLAGALVGYLPYNLPPASVFLGDAGSMLIGLVVGTLAINCSLKGPATIALASPIALLIIPIFDSCAAIIRRRLTGRSIFVTDRGHLHHCLMHRGLSNHRVLLVVSFFCLISVLGALASLALNNELYALLAAGAVVAILIVTRLFGYAEFLLVKNQLMAGVTSMIENRARHSVRQITVHLQGSANWARLWNTLTTHAAELNLRTMCFDINAPFLYEGYHARWAQDAEPVTDRDLWRVELPLIMGGKTVGRLEVTGIRDREPVWMKVATLAATLDDFNTLNHLHAEPSARTVTPQALDSKVHEVVS